MSKLTKIRNETLEALGKIQGDNNNMVFETTDYHLGKCCNTLAKMDLGETDQSIVARLFRDKLFGEALINARRKLKIPSDYVCAGNWFFSTYEEAETELISHIVYQNTLVPVELMSKFKVNMLEKETLNALRKHIASEVSKIIYSFHLPIGYDIFVIACILNPYTIEDNLSVIKNSKSKARVISSDDNQIIVAYSKNITRSELERTKEVIAAYAGYNIPENELNEDEYGETLRMVKDQEKGMKVADIARKYFPDLCKVENGGGGDSDGVRMASDVVRKRIERFKKRKV